MREVLDRPREDPLVPVSMAIDDGEAPDMVFDLVFACRSGAWVPPWSGNAFTAFLQSAPVPKAVHGRNQWAHPRPDPARMRTMKAELYARAAEILGREG